MGLPRSSHGHLAARIESNADSHRSLTASVGVKTEAIVDDRGGENKSNREYIKDQDVDLRQSHAME